MMNFYILNGDICIYIRLNTKWEKKIRNMELILIFRNSIRQIYKFQDTIEIKIAIFLLLTK